MTMPHLMNCPHSDTGWCLSCVGALYAENERLKAKLAHTEQQNIELNHRVEVEDADVIERLQAKLAASVPREVAEHVTAACCAVTNPETSKFCRGLTLKESIAKCFLATTEPSESRAVIRPVFDELLALARAEAERAEKDPRP